MTTYKKTPNNINKFMASFIHKGITINELLYKLLNILRVNYHKCDEEFGLNTYILYYRGKHPTEVSQHCNGLIIQFILDEKTRKVKEWVNICVPPCVAIPYTEESYNYFADKMDEDPYEDSTYEGTNVNIFWHQGEWKYSTPKRYNAYESYWSDNKSIGELFDVHFKQIDAEFSFQKNITYHFCFIHPNLRHTFEAHEACLIPMSFAYNKNGVKKCMPFRYRMKKEYNHIRYQDIVLTIPKRGMVYRFSNGTALIQDSEVFLQNKKIRGNIPNVREQFIMHANNGDIEAMKKLATDFPGQSLHILNDDYYRFESVYGPHTFSRTHSENVYQRTPSDILKEIESMQNEDIETLWLETQEEIDLCESHGFDPLPVY